MYIISSHPRQQANKISQGQKHGRDQTNMFIIFKAWHIDFAYIFIEGKSKSYNKQIHDHVKCMTHLYLPRCTTAPRHQCMIILIHVHGISRQDMERNPNLAR